MKNESQDGLSCQSSKSVTEFCRVPTKWTDPIDNIPPKGARRTAVSTPGHGNIPLFVTVVSYRCILNGC